MNRVATSSVNARLGRAFDRDLVVVVDPAQVGEPEVAGERRRLAARCPPSCSRRRRARRRRSRTASKPGWLKCAPSQRRAIAMPTLVAKPWPSGPVVVSTPVVQRYSGWPGHLLSSWRNFLMSSSDTVGVPSALVRRVDRLGLRQVQHRVQQHRRVARRQHEPIAVRPDRILRVEAQDLAATARTRTGASAIGVPGCPELAACTASMLSVRIVLMHSWSSSASVTRTPDGICSG